jgi:hypothetical protein
MNSDYLPFNVRSVPLGPIQPRAIQPRAIGTPPAQPQRWIKFSDLAFAGPTLLGLEPSFNFGGVYAVLVLDTQWGPMPYRPIYFGEAGNMSERVCPSHEKYKSWERAARGGLLFVAFHVIPNEAARKAAEKQLIGQYSPECNVTHNAFAALLGY